MVTPPFYLPYLNFAEAIFAAVCFAATIVLMGNLLYRARFDPEAVATKSFSASMYIFLTSNVLLATLALPYHVYVIGWWRPPPSSPALPVQNGIASLGLLVAPTQLPATNYNLHLIYWLDMHTVLYGGVQSLPLAFLTLDRCLVMRMLPTAKFLTLQSRLAKCSVFATLGVYLVLVGFFLWELPLQVDRVSHCVNAPCMMLKLRTAPFLAAKNIFETLSLLLCCYFFYVLGQRRREGAAVANKMKTKLISTLLVYEICFNVIPTYTSTTFTLITHQSIVIYTGRFAGTFNALYALSSSMLYSRRLLKKQHGEGKPPTATKNVVAPMTIAITNNPQKMAEKGRNHHTCTNLPQHSQQPKQYNVT